MIRRFLALVLLTLVVFACSVTFDDDPLAGSARGSFPTSTAAVLPGRHTVLSEATAVPKILYVKQEIGFENGAKQLMCTGLCEGDETALELTITPATGVTPSRTPTDTPTPRPTITPIPTNTARPTSTPLPTNTPTQTATPMLSRTPTKTPTSGHEATPTVDTAPQPTPGPTGEPKLCILQAAESMRVRSSPEIPAPSLSPTANVIGSWYPADSFRGLRIFDQFKYVPNGFLWGHHQQGWSAVFHEPTDTMYAYGSLTSDNCREVPGWPSHIMPPDPLVQRKPAAHLVNSVPGENQIAHRAVCPAVVVTFKSDL